MPEEEEEEEEEEEPETKEDEPKKKRESPGCIDLLLMLFIGIFYAPIMFLAHKIKGGGVGFGPAFASFAAATVIMMGLVAAIASAAIAVAVYTFK